MSLTDTTPTTRAATAGVDWAKDNHAVCVVDADGEPVERVTVVHNSVGLDRLIAVLARHRVDDVGIERRTGRWSMRYWPPATRCM